MEQNVKDLVGNKSETIKLQMQKAILISSLLIARILKLSCWAIQMNYMNIDFNRMIPKGLFCLLGGRGDGCSSVNLQLSFIGFHNTLWI